MVNISHVVLDVCNAQSNEAKAAFERGGGGKRAEAVRLLADAKHSSGGKRSAAGAKSAAGRWAGMHV